MKYIILVLCTITLVACGSSVNTKPQSELGYNGKATGVFGFKSTQELLANLKSDPENIIRTVQGDYGAWIIVNHRSEYSLWSFTPEEHPAHPSVVKRTPVEKNGNIFIQTEASCNSKKEVCDQLIKSFIELNNKTRDSFGA